MTTANRQPDLFAPRQADLLGAHDPYPQTPEAASLRVRPRLHALLAEARAATRMPWSAKDARVNAIVFHNSANWLPAAERDALRAAFRAELDRLAAAERDA